MIFYVKSVYICHVIKFYSQSNFDTRNYLVPFLSSIRKHNNFGRYDLFLYNYVILVSTPFMVIIIKVLEN